MANCVQIMLVLTIILAATYGTMTVNSATHASNRDDIECPTWQFYNRKTNICECGNDIRGAVRCNQTLKSAQILDCFCITLNKTNQTEVGKCFIGCEHSLLKKDLVFNQLPEDKHQLNNWLCGELNKNGAFCGKCKKGYSRVVYTYDLDCRNCTSSRSYNIVKFLAVAFGPLTLFYIIVVIFKVSATSPRFSSYVIFCQWITEPISVRVTLRTTRKFPAIDVITRILTSAYGIWNLDFFRSLHPPICLDVSTLSTLALDYAGAFFSLFLILITYFLIKLYSRNVRVIVFIWRPIECVLSSFKEQWNTKASMINVFATFFFLSYVKLVSVSFTLLLPTTVYDIYGNNVGKYLYYDASIPYLGRQHLPFAVLAILVSLLLVVVPSLFLTLYPFKWFQKCLNHCRITQPALHTFADCYLGWYKDGTVAGTRDCRFVTSMYLALRICMFIFYAFSLSLYVYAFAAVAMISFATLIFIIKPYKQQWDVYNTIDPAMVLLIAIWYIMVVCTDIASEKAYELIYFSVILCFLVGSLPLVCMSGIIIYRLFKHCSVFRRLFSMLKLKIHGRHSGYEEIVTSEDVLEQQRLEYPDNNYQAAAANSTIQDII